MATSEDAQYATAGTADSASQCAGTYGSKECGTITWDKCADYHKGYVSQVRREDVEDDAVRPSVTSIHSYHGLWNMQNIMLLRFVLAVVLTEALSEIGSDAVLFERLRAQLEKDPKQPTLLGIFSRCAYCQSLWCGVGMSYLLWLAPILDTWWLPEAWQPLVMGFVIHRVSNLWHDVLKSMMETVRVIAWRLAGAQIPAPDDEGKHGNKRKV